MIFYLLQCVVVVVVYVWEVAQQICLLVCPGKSLIKSDVLFFKSKATLVVKAFLKIYLF